jgi:uncharacterized protein (TIGR00255 family)
MIKSMTGYGKAEKEVNGIRYIAEVKTLNSKQFDPMVRIPPNFKDKELDIRSLLSTKLERGKIDFTLTFDESEKHDSVFINKSVAVKLYHEILGLKKELGLEYDDPSILSTLLKMPEVLQPKTDVPDDEHWTQVFEVIRQAVQLCDESRIEEGKKLHSEFANRIATITDLDRQVTPFETERTVKIREKFRKELQNAFDADKIDENRFEQELIYYIEKIDITEEKVRLKNHCEYFLQTLAETESGGKKLAFIIQEIGREINTLGSKANDWNIQKLVVLMKDELEKIKEQLFNIL